MVGPGQSKEVRVEERAGTQSEEFTALNLDQNSTVSLCINRFELQEAKTREKSSKGEIYLRLGALQTGQR